jgi:hypothetical protein
MKYLLGLVLAFLLAVSLARGQSPKGSTSEGASNGGLVLDGVNWGTLNNPEMMRLISNDVTVFFDLNLLRSDPSLLKDPEILKYFVLINNCANLQQVPQIRKAMGNELDYPAISGFYMGKATELLAGIPRTTQLAVVDAALGDYDTVRKAFPIVRAHPGNTPKQVQLPKQAHVVADSRDSCAGSSFANRAASVKAGKLAAIYVLDFDQARTFSEIPMTPDEARKYIENAQPFRTVSFDAELTVLDNPAPKVTKNCDYQPCVEFPARLDKVSVVKPYNRQMLTHSPDKTIAVIYP